MATLVLDIQGESLVQKAYRFDVLRFEVVHEFFIKK